jgi:hypothetical protein
MPRGMSGWAWSSPSRVLIRPKAVHSNRRAPGCGPAVVARSDPLAPAPRNCVARRRFQQSTSRARITTANSDSCTSCEPKAEPIVELSVESPELIPGMTNSHAPVIDERTRPPTAARTRDSVLPGRAGNLPSLRAPHRSGKGVFAREAFWTCRSGPCETSGPWHESF